MNAYVQVYTSTLQTLIEKFCDRHSININSKHSKATPIDILFFEVRKEKYKEDFLVIQRMHAQFPAGTIILFSDDLSQDLLIQSMRIGVREVLSVSSSEIDLDQAWERSFPLAIQPASNLSRSTQKKQIVSFLPCRGGSGATLLSCNLAYYLAQEAKQVISFIDLDLHSGDATFYLCNDQQKNSLSDLTSQVDRLDGHLFKTSMHDVVPNFHLLAAPPHAEHALTMKPDHIDKVMTLARENFDLVLVDLNAALNASALKALDHSDVICIVMDFSIMQLRDAKRLLTLLLNLGYPREKFHFIGIDHSNSAPLDPHKIEENLGSPLYLMVPAASRAADDACNQGLPLSKISGGHVIMSSIHKLAHLLFGIPEQKPQRWLANWF